MESYCFLVESRNMGMERTEISLVDSTQTEEKEGQGSLKTQVRTCVRGVSEEPREEWDVMFLCCPMDVLWSFHSRSQSPGEGLEHCLYIPDRTGVWSCGEVLEERAWARGLEGGQYSRNFLGQRGGARLCAA